MTRTTTTTNSHTELPQESRDFHAHYLFTVQHLRSTLIEAYQSIGVDIESPREAARQLKLDKNLTWKVSRIIKSEDDVRIAASVPGPSGIAKLLDGLTGAGASPVVIHDVRKSFASFSDMVELHTTDRASLELMLDSWADMGADPLEKSRKLAYQGNSGIWGIQAAVRLSCFVVAPSEADPAVLDYVQLGGYTNLQRLRPTAGWPLLRLRAFNDDGSPPIANMKPLSPNPDPSVPLLMNDFLAGNHPDVRLRQDERGIVYELAEGPVGRTGLFSAYYGYIDRGSLTRYRDEHNQMGEFLTIINTPMEMLVCDLIVHQDLAEQFAPQARVYGRASGLMDEHEQRDEGTLLPLSEKLRPLPVGMASLATPLVPRYPELVSQAFETAGWDLSAFTGWRLKLPYPPMPATVSVGFELPTRPSS